MPIDWLGRRILYILYLSRRKLFYRPYVYTPSSGLPYSKCIRTKHPEESLSNPQQSPFRPIRQLRPPQSMLVEQPHLALPPETKIRNPTLDQNLPDQTPSTIPHVHPIPTPTIHIPVNIALDPIRRPRIRHREHPSIDQERTLADDHNVKRINRRRSRLVRRPVPVHKVRVGDVHRVFARRETDPVRPSEAVGHDAYIPALGLEPIHLLG